MLKRQGKLTTDIKEIKDCNETGNAVYHMFRHYRGGSMNEGFEMHDSCAIAYIAKPELFTTQKTRVEVELKGTHTYGCTVVDLKNRLNLPDNAEVCTDIDEREFSKWLTGALKKSI